MKTPEDDLDYTVEALGVNPGGSVKQGEELCHLAYHRQLYIRGEAFEDDLHVLQEMRAAGETLTAEFGHEPFGEHGGATIRSGLEVLYVDNHVDSETQTYLFYVPLENDPAQDVSDPGGRVFRTWTFKPGQRVHVRVPTQKSTGVMVVPLTALASAGAETYVFRKLDEEDHLADHDDDDHEDEEDHADHDQDNHDHENHFAEFGPVPVHVPRRNGAFAVIGEGGEVSVGDEIAMNGAYELLLAWKLQTSGGGGHHHHDH